MTGARVARRLRVSTGKAAQKLYKTWWTNPREILAFAGRLGGAVFAVGVRRRFPRFSSVMSQTLRTFLRGITPVVFVGFAVGLGLGAVADRFGVVLQPLAEQTFVLAMVRDGMPLILALLLAARSGASVAARLGDDRQTRFATGLADERELLTTTVPHLVAGAATGWIFSRIAGPLVVAGYRSQGSVAELVDGFLESVSLPLDPELPMDRAVADASTKTALFGFIIAFVASGLGIAANEAPNRSPRQRAIALQDTVWESGVTAIILCLLAAIMWWNVRGTVT
jgi:ABC-type transporter Mla maintaining outer membrane lipid asymmetry permease subunit MlaE